MVAVPAAAYSCDRSGRLVDKFEGQDVVVRLTYEHLLVEILGSLLGPGDTLGGSAASRSTSSSDRTSAIVIYSMRRVADQPPILRCTDR